ncbi:MAG TPA: glycoside hydrolase family 2 TIM barrel-domain containing protein, partial [Verrucomicrobiae bacterium]|nr:glycoside hydrolase family 2 TIM barrel-domain containing protein [Verrucomicrobiae bacterium]
MLKFQSSLLLLASISWLVASPISANAESEFPGHLSGEWKPVGRLEIHTNQDSITLQGGYIVEKQAWGDSEIQLRMRAPAGVEQVQLWGGFRCRDRDSRYIFALRGGENNDIYLARYAPDGGAKFLGFAPLDFKPVPGTWYRLRILISGNRFQIYLGDETLPRLNALDADASWTEGSVALGGGWLPSEYAELQVAPLSPEAKTAFDALGDKTWALPRPDKEALRQSQRATYHPITVEKLGALRTEISLDGNWLFMPDYQIANEEKPSSPAVDDNAWHVMEVPQFWTPGLSWLHGETGFPDLKGVSQTKGVADSLYVQEYRRVESYTFDWRKTKSAWYRQYVNLPDGVQDHHVELAFDAIAKISEIWVNGIKVGTHAGMFGRVAYEVSQAIKPGRNVIAVHVISEGDTQSGAKNKVEGVAVTVEVTSKMLHSLPHGMFQDDVGGIWQPVKLIVTPRVWVNEPFVQPSLHGANIDLDVSNSTELAETRDLEYSIVSVKDGTLLLAGKGPQAIQLPPGETKHVRFSTPHLDPRLWSPQDPNLYNLELRLKKGGAVDDQSSVRFGFRTFIVDGGRFLLNGQPYWLRGANPFPNTLRPNDAVLARRFIQIAREGNVRATRSHIVPFTTTWLDAADEEGMAVSYEGTWPWLMLTGEPPDQNLLKIWKDEFLSLIQEHRNHPSLVLWTVNNEMKFPVLDENDPVRLKKKWIILDDMIKAMRAADSTRPVVADSAYDRKEAAKGYRSTVKPNGFDDGDVDDVHRYYGWYNESFFHFYDGEFGTQFYTSGRPLISQEMATGYPRSDDGHAARFYLFKHYTPQAFVGEDAYENADPAIFLTRQAFMTKELMETFRRANHDSTAGILSFSYFTWLRSAWNANDIQPWLAYDGLKTALQPVLVSAELYGRHFYSGKTISRRICIINDSEESTATPGTELHWAFCVGNNVLSQGSLAVPPVGFYSNHWLNVSFRTPDSLPAPRVDAQLVLSLKSGATVLSENRYDIVLATLGWATGDG